MESIFLWLITREEAFIAGTIKLEIEDEHAASKADHPVELGCAGGVRREQGGGRHDASSAPGAKRQALRLRAGRGDVAQVGSLEHYGGLLKRVADMAFNKGEHGA
jgi:hypothetical protein